MHALGQYLRQEMDRRGFRYGQDLANLTGVSKQNMSKLIAPGRARLGGMLADDTVRKLSVGLGVDEAFILRKCAEAMGIPVDRMVASADPDSIPDDVLIETLRRRLAEAKKIHEAPENLDGKVQTLSDGVSVAGAEDTEIDVPSPHRSRKTPESRVSMRTITPYEPLIDAAQKWPDWLFELWPLPSEVAVRISYRRRRVRVDPDKFGGDVARALANGVCALDLGATHMKSEPLASEDADGLAMLRLGRAEL